MTSVSLAAPLTCLNQCFVWRTSATVALAASVHVSTAVAIIGSHISTPVAQCVVLRFDS